MADDQVLDFTSGGAAAEDFKKKEDAARAAARGNTQYLSLKNDGDFAIVRFLFESEPQPGDPTAGWIWTKQHVQIKTKAAPKDKPEKSSWPDRVTAVCRRTPIGPNQAPAFPACYICDNVKNERGWAERPQMHLWAGAVLREEVVGTPEMVEEGRIHESQVGQRLILDQMDLIDELDAKGNTTGRKVWKKRYVIINQRIDNYFSTLISSGIYHKTILDRDYRITRKGEKGAKSQFVTNSLDPYEVTVLRNGEPVVIRYDLREPEIAALYADSGVDRQSLLKLISRRVSDGFYNRFFDPRVEVLWNEGRDDEEDSDSGPATPPPPTPAQQAGQSITQEPTQGVAADALAAMRDRVMRGNAPAAPAAPAAPPAAPAAPAPAAASTIPAAPAAAAPQAVPPAPVAPAPAPLPVQV